MDPQQQPQYQYPAPPQMNWQATPPPPPKKPRRWPWVVGGLVAVVIIGSALGGNDEDAPEAAEPVQEVTTTAPAEVETTPEPEPTTPEPEPEPTTEEPAWDSAGYDETTVVLELTWADTDAEARDDLCFGWTYLGEDYVVETLNAEGTFNEQAIVDFFEARCSA